MQSVSNANVGRGAVLMEKREHIRLERVEGDRNRVEQQDARIVWFDTAGLRSPADGDGMLGRVVNLAYTGAVLHPENAAALAPALPARFVKVLSAAKTEDLATLAQLPGGGAGFVIASADVAVLEEARRKGLSTCYHAYVDDGASLDGAIREGHRHEYLLIRFRDPTNIPLELVIATLQATRTVLVKEIDRKSVV